jgi:hypothetical protein
VWGGCGVEDDVSGESARTSSEFLAPRPLERCNIRIKRETLLSLSYHLFFSYLCI